MNNFNIIIVIISLIIILFCAFYKGYKEGLTNRNKIILMGDSILNNSNYVSQGDSVYDNLKKQTQPNNILNVAKDGATINDLYLQLDKIPLNLNNSDTYIFISAGGNNILNNNHLNSQEITKLFNTYLEFLKALRVKLGNTNINILNLYQPSNPRYNSYKQSIKQWNQLINKNSNKVGEMYNVVDVYSLLTSPNDFVYDIEPSNIASQKIANLIYLST